MAADESSRRLFEAQKRLHDGILGKNPAQEKRSADPVDRPEHYTSHPSGVECADIIEHMPCMIGFAIKYLWRHGLKAGADADQDLRKAIWCIERERLRLAKMRSGNGE
jgi:hypothetical protein